MLTNTQCTGQTIASILIFISNYRNLLTMKYRTPSFIQICSLLAISLIFHPKFVNNFFHSARKVSLQRKNSEKSCIGLLVDICLNNCAGYQESTSPGHASKCQQHHWKKGAKKRAWNTTIQNQNCRLACTVTVSKHALSNVYEMIFRSNDSVMKQTNGRQFECQQKMLWL